MSTSSAQQQSQSVKLIQRISVSVTTDLASLQAGGSGMANTAAVPAAAASSEAEARSNNEASTSSCGDGSINYRQVRRCNAL
jgi:hypothetical protein